MILKVTDDTIYITEEMFRYAVYFPEEYRNRLKIYDFKKEEAKEKMKEKDNVENRNSL